MSQQQHNWYTKTKKMLNLYACRCHETNHMTRDYRLQYGKIIVDRDQGKKYGVKNEVTFWQIVQEM